MQGSCLGVTGGGGGRRGARRAKRLCGGGGGAGESVREVGGEEMGKLEDKREQSCTLGHRNVGGQAAHMVQGACFI